MTTTKLIAIHAEVQFACPLDNAVRLCHQLRGLAHLQPDLVITSELTLTGYPMDGRALPWEAAATMAAIDLVAHTACELGIPVLLGTLYFQDGLTVPTNALLLLDGASRRVVCEKHQQKTLPAGHAYSTDYAYGTIREAFQVKALRCVPLICAESLDEAIVHQVKQLQPDIVIHPSAWGGDAGEPYARTTARESLFQAELVLVVNQTGSHLGDWPHAETFVYQHQAVTALVKSKESHALLLAIEKDAAGHTTVVECTVISEISPSRASEQGASLDS